MTTIHPPANISFGSRIRKSPFYDSTRKYGAKGFTIYNHMYMPTVYTSPEDEYFSLTNDVTMWDVAAERQVEINGPDAYKFIRTLTPRNLEKCEIGHCLYILLTGEDGGIINDAVLLRVKPDQFWISPGDSGVLLWIQGAAVNSGMDVNVFEPDVSPLQIGGPKAHLLIEKLFDEAHKNVGYYRAMETSLEGIPLVLARTGWSGEISYELYLRNHKLGNQLWEIVREAGLEFNITPIAPNAIRSIEGGLLSYASDILREDTPFSIGLNRLVDTNQSVEFIGKAALKKIEEEGTKRKLVGIVVEGSPIKSPPEQFWPVLDNDLKIGHVSRCIYSPRLDKNIGFANVPIEFSDTDMTFSVSTPDGDKMATVCKWPWFPAERINKKT